MAIWYRTGTASIANGGQVVTGTLTGWINQTRAGDRITFDGGGTWYEIAQDPSLNTELTIATAYAGTTVSGGAYAIDRSSPKWTLASDLALRVASLLAATTHILSGTAAPASTDGIDGDVWVKTSAPVTFYGPKSGGTWPTGVVLQAGVALANMLLNGDFQINQRAFAGGSLSPGVYGFDRWKATGSGCTVSVSGLVVTLTSGGIAQVIETAQLALATLASTQVTVSVESLTGGSLTVTAGSASGTITAGSGRRTVTLTTGAGDTGNLTVSLTPASGAVTFQRVKAELGPLATDWSPPRVDDELRRCQRYYWRVGGVAFNMVGVGRFVSTTQGEIALQLPVPMRATPTLSVNAAANFQFNGVACTSVTINAGYNQRPGLLVLSATCGSAAGTAGDMAALVTQPSTPGIVELTAEI